MTSSSSNDAAGCLFAAYRCAHISCLCDCGCRATRECLCLRETYCFEPCGKTEPRLLGFEMNDKSDEICKVGVFCWDAALIYPQGLCGCADQTLCMRKAVSFLYHKDYVDTPRLACYGISCCPEFGIAMKPPTIPALERMSRD